MVRQTGSLKLVPLVRQTCDVDYLNYSNNRAMSLQCHITLFKEINIQWLTCIGLYIISLDMRNYLKTEKNCTLHF